MSRPWWKSRNRSAQKSRSAFRRGGERDLVAIRPRRPHRPGGRSRATRHRHAPEQAELWIEDIASLVAELQGESGQLLGSRLLAWGRGAFEQRERRLLQRVRVVHGAG